jgi:hypothetical protein
VGRPKPKSPQKNAPRYSKTFHTTKRKIHLQGVCHTMALPFTLKNILRQKKNYGNSNISPCKNMMFKKFSKKTDILQVLGN